MSLDRSQCPARDCKATDPLQQRISADILIEAGAVGDWTADARICISCGCVYSFYESAKLIQGFYDNPIAGPGWQATLSPDK